MFLVFFLHPGKKFKYVNQRNVLCKHNMKIRKVINRSGIGELSLPMLLAANFCSVEVWKSYTVSFQYSF